MVQVAKIRGKGKERKLGLEREVSSSMDANMPIKKTSGHLARLKKKSGDGSPCRQMFHGIESRAMQIIFSPGFLFGLENTTPRAHLEEMCVVREGRTLAVAAVLLG